MQRKRLSINEYIPAAKIFLNIFGLVLDDDYIIKKDDKIVGKMLINENEVLIDACYDNVSLSSKFEVPIGSGLVDTESNNALFGEWKIPIKFVLISNNINYNGEMLFECIVDSEFGINCLLHPEINIQSLNNEKINLKIQRDFTMFGFKMLKDNYQEEVRISPFSSYNSYLVHDIKKGKPEEYKYPYSFYAGVFPGGKGNEDKLHIYLEENENEDNMERILSSENKMIPRDIKEDISESCIQKGLVMQQLDKDMYNKIHLIKELLVIGNVSVLDNLISICYDSFKDEEIASLLGIERKKMNYQDHSANMIKAYFGDKLLSKEQIKRLLKRQE